MQQFHKMKKNGETTFLLNVLRHNVNFGQTGPEFDTLLGYR